MAQPVPTTEPLYPRAAPFQDELAPCLTKRSPSDFPKLTTKVTSPTRHPQMILLRSIKMKMESKKVRIIFIPWKHSCKNVSIRL